VNPEQLLNEHNQELSARLLALKPQSQPLTPFQQRAQILLQRNIPTFPLPPRTKAAKLQNWETLATIDHTILAALNPDPDANTAAVAYAQPGGTFFLEIDISGYAKIIEEQTGKKLPATFAVSSRKGEGRGHFYFHHNPETIALAKKIGKAYISVQQDGKEACSVRLNNAYVVGPGSIHPDTQKCYEIVQDIEIADGPVWLIEWAAQQAAQQNKTEHPKLDDKEPIFEGSRNSSLTSELGRARQVMGMDAEQLYQYGLSVNQKRCVPPLPESEVKTIANSMAGYDIKPSGVGTVILNGQVLGQAPLEIPPEKWRSQFRNLSEMEQGDIVMIIDGVLQEGTCFLGANPGNGKTLVALAFAKAICLGEPLFGISDYAVKQPRNVIYLIPESGDKAFRKRGEAFRLPSDDRFIARTISSGGPLGLSDPSLMEAIRQMKPVVILDTASRFLQANDENSAAQNRLLVNDIMALRAAGAVCVIILHHAKKSQSTKREMMTLDNMLRGTSDFGAMCDQAYGIRMDEHLYNRGAGPMEIELANLKDRERLGGLTSVRLAASYKNPGAIFPTSYIDEIGNFSPVNFKETRVRDEATLNSLVEANPTMTVAELSEATGIKPYTVKESLKRFGWHCVKGGPDGRSPWHKDGEQGCPYQKARKSAAVSLDLPAEPSLVRVN
jgi:hypothetical protein